MSYEPCSQIAATRMIQIIPDIHLDKKKLLEDFVNKTCMYQPPEVTRRDIYWSKLRNILVQNFRPEHVGPELCEKIRVIYMQDEENDK